MPPSVTPCAIVVLISGNGSNLQAIINATLNNSISAKISAVISNREDAYGLERAQKSGIATHVLSHQGYADRNSYDLALDKLITKINPDLVVLAGFMRILSDGFVEKYAGKLINIHPSLLPKYSGMLTHQRALAAGDTQHGATVHFVTAQLDAGPRIIQGKVPVKKDDDEQKLALRVLDVEHIIYPQAIQLITTQRIKLQNDQVLLDGAVLAEPILHD